MKHNKLLFGSVILVAFMLRFYAIDRYGTGYDEQFSVFEANGIVLSELPTGTYFNKQQLDATDHLDGARRACIDSDGGNGIIYILLLHLWTTMFTNSDMSIRMLSLLFGLLAVVLVKKLAMVILNDRRVAILSSIMAALSPLMVDYSQEARSYLPATCFTILATIYFFRLADGSRSDKRHWLFYGIWVGLALLTHYSTVYAFVGHVSIAIVRFRTWPQWRAGFFAAFVTIAIVSIWMLAGGLDGLEKMTAQNEDYMSVIRNNPNYSVYYERASLASVAQGATVQLLWLFGNALQFLGPQLRTLVLLLAIPGGIILLGYSGSEGRRERGRLLELGVLALIGIGYAVVLAIISGHTFGSRYYYVMFGAPFASILLGYSINAALLSRQRWKRWSGGLLLVCQITIMFISILGFYANGYRGNRSPATVAASASRISSLITDNPTGQYLIVHSSDREAAATNLYLEAVANEVPQLIDPLSPYATVLIGHDHLDARVLEVRP